MKKLGLLLLVVLAVPLCANSQDLQITDSVVWQWSSVEKQLESAIEAATGITVKDQCAVT
jgi:hypothetical protein